MRALIPLVGCRWLDLRCANPIRAYCWSTLRADSRGVQAAARSDSKGGRVLRTAKIVALGHVRLSQFARMPPTRLRADESCPFIALRRRALSPLKYPASI